MKALLNQLWNDEAGFVMSAELVLICTICVLSVCVGLSTLCSAVTAEIDHCASAFGALNQSWCPVCSDDGGSRDGPHHPRGHHNGWQGHSHGYDVDHD